MSSSSKPYELGLKLDNAKEGSAYASTSKPFISSIILNVEVRSALLSTTRIFLGLWTMLLLLLIKLLGFQTPN